MTIELLQFPASHYNEKVRWALAYKQVPHHRTSLLPGPHMLRIRRLTGQTSTPVLRLDGDAVHGSARIIDALEKRFPEPALYPQDPELRERALGIQAHFDEEVGPRVRRALFSVMVDEHGFMCATFARGHSAPVRALYRATFPLVAGVIKQSNGVTGEDAIADAFDGTRAALDYVAKNAGPEGYLAGPGFSVADLAAAALLAPTVELSHPDMARPRPIPAVIEDWIARWRDHPGAAWVRETFARHRAPAQGS